MPGTNTIQMWAGDDRLKLWYKSPNQAGAFLSLSVLSLLWVTLYYKGRHQAVVRTLSSLFLVASTVLLLMTASRGGMLATLLPAAIMVGYRCRRWLFANWRRLGLVALTGIALSGGIMLLCFRLHGSSPRADSLRWNMWKAAPAMMRAAPEGWGTPRAVGLAYHAWFENDRAGLIQTNLVNDHLTSVVALGWVKGTLYLLTWVLLTVVLYFYAFRGASVLPAVVWTSLQISSFFNVVLGALTVWIIPALSLLLIIPSLKKLRFREFAIAAILSVIVALAMMSTLYLCGGNGNGPEIRFANGIVSVNGDNPKIFIVDDGKALAGWKMPSEVRTYYEKFPRSPAVSIAGDIDQIPSRGIDLLVLSGDAAEAYIVKFDEDHNSVPIPKHILLLSPLIVPSCVSADLRRLSDVTIVVGSEIAKQSEEYSKPASWMTIVQGEGPAIHGWMKYVMAAFEK